MGSVFLTFFCLFQASAHQKNLDVGANIFIGNLDPEVDEKLLYDTFSAFGVILQTPKVGNNFIISQILTDPYFEERYH